MPSSTDVDEPSTRSQTVAQPLTPYVDWLVAALATVAGLGFLVGGTAMTVMIERESFATAIRSEPIDTSVLSEAETIEITLQIVTWAGMGLLVAGGLLIGAAITYLVYKRRLRRRRKAGETVDYYLSNVVVGATFGAVLSFVPLSVALGGGLAGYLEWPLSERSISAGALSGVVSIAPMLVVSLFVLVGSVLGLREVGESSLAALIGLGGLLAVVIFTTIVTTLGAIGGFAGGKLAQR